MGLQIGSLFAQPTNDGLQILFKDNRSVKFNKLPIEHTCLCEKKGKETVRGWKHYYKNQYLHRGYKNLPVGKATLSFERDIVLNIHGVLTENELPQKSGDIKQHSDIGISRIRQIAATPKINPSQELINIVLSAVLIILVLGWMIGYGMDRAA